MRLNTVISPCMGDVESLRRVKSLVAKVALNAVMAEAQADDFIVVRRGSLFHMEVLVSRSDSNWGQLGGATSQLRQALSEAGDFVSESVLEDGRNCLTVKVALPDEPVAALLVRDTPFDAAHRDVLHRMVRSVLLAGQDWSEHRPLLMVDIEPHASGFRSTVIVDRPGARPSMAINADAAVATATAATALAESSVSLRFAAQTSLEDGIVSIVLVEADDGGPIFGVSLDSGKGESGPAAAVFRAAHFVKAPELTRV